MKKIGMLLSIVVVMVLGLVLSANAALVDMNDGTIYDTDTQLSWLKDVRWMGGYKTWDEALAWASSLNANGGFAGLSGWRLPITNPACGQGYNCATSEIGHLYYTELHNAEQGPLTNSGPFTDLYSPLWGNGYWLGTQVESDPSLAYWFSFDNGGQWVTYKTVGNIATAVRPGARSFILARRQGTPGNYVVTVDQPPTFRPLQDPEIPIGTNVTISVQDGGPFSLDISGKDGPGTDTGYFGVQGTYSFPTSVEGKERMLFGRTGEGFFQVEFVAVPFAYNNTVNDRQAWQPIFQPGLSVEAGDEITLAGTERYVNDIDILVFQSHSSGTGTPYTGTIDARVRFYQNNGPSGEPGTLLWDSGVIQNIPYGEGYNTFSFNVPSVHVPDTFVWTIELLNVQPANPADPYNFGLLLYDPPVVGSSGNFIWEKNVSWAKVVPTPYTYDYSYGARVQASALPVAQTYTITAAVTNYDSGNPGNGSITVNGGAPPATVNAGDNITYTITPNPGWVVYSVLVDGVQKGGITSYTFTNVQANHTLSAHVRPVTYTITASAVPNGTISPSGVSTVNAGSDMTFTITPKAGYRVQYVVVDGVEFAPMLADGSPPISYPFTDIQANHTISATFAPNRTYTITATAGANGSISPLGSLSVLGGANQKFTITPAAGYRVENVVIDGMSKGVLTSYTFYSVQGDHSISVSFVLDVYTIDITLAAGGNITVTGTGTSFVPFATSWVSGGSTQVTVNPGEGVTITIIPDRGRSVLSVADNGSYRYGITTYTLTNIRKNHTINVYFR